MEVSFLSITFFIPVLVILVVDELQYSIKKHFMEMKLFEVYYIFRSTFCSEECIFDGSIT